jgi:small subunit ribosomal protein S6
MVREKQRKYEVLLVFNPNTQEAVLEERLKKIEEVARGHSGVVEKREVWGKRSLAYTISNYKYGLFVAINVNGLGSIVADLRRQISLMDEVLRSTIMTKNDYSPDLNGRLKGDFTYGYRPPHTQTFGLLGDDKEEGLEDADELLASV